MLETYQVASQEYVLRKRQKASKQQRLYFFMTIPALAIMACVLVPFLYGVWLSFTNYTLISPQYHFIGIQNYLQVISGLSGFWHSLRITFEFMILVVVVELPLGIFLATILNSGRVFVPGISRSLVLIPLMMPPVVAGLMWKIIVSPGQLVPQILSVVGLGNWPWLSGLHTALVSVVVMDVWINTPFVALIIFAGLQGMPKATQEAAAIDGANMMYRFWRITLPQLKPFIILAFLFRMIMSLQQFDLIYSSTQGGPVNATLSAIVDAYQQAMQFNNVAYSLSEIVLMWIISYVMSWIVFRWQFAKDSTEGAAR